MLEIPVKQHAELGKTARIAQASPKCHEIFSGHRAKKALDFLFFKVSLSSQYVPGKIGNLILHLITFI